jgi:hypothetical protein
MDFAENFTTKYQDECQSAHWCYDQVTIHPIVCYYNGASGKTVTQEVVYISNDLTHDANLVDHFFKNFVEFLQHHYSRQQTPSHDLIPPKMSFYFNVFTVTANIKEWDFGFVLT